MGLKALDERLGARVLEGRDALPLLVQFGRPQCVKCGPFSSDVRKMLDPPANEQRFSFEWIYVDLGNDENDDAQERFGLTTLPAFALYAGGDDVDPPDVVNSATRHTLQQSLDRAGARVQTLVLDADF